MKKAEKEIHNQKPI